jgi:acetyltransferase
MRNPEKLLKIYWILAFAGMTLNKNLFKFSNISYNIVMKEANNLDKLFNPSSIAIVGATEKEGKVGRVVAKNVLELGYLGKVFLVNPNYQELFGQKCYPDLGSIEEEVDVAIIIIPASVVNDTIKNAANKVKNFVIISSGFSEIGEKGKERETELLKIANDYNLNILGPNCLGFIVPGLKLNASFAGGLPKKGNIALATQSGALAVAILDMAKKENLKFSKIISIGNKMQIDEKEMIEYLGSDKKTKVVGLYLEGIKNGSEFMEIAKNFSQKKPIVALKAGKTEKSQKAIASHTGALAGSDEIMNAAFESTGIIRAQDLEHFIGLLKLISSFAPPENDEVAVLTNAGGPGVLTTDAFMGKQIKLADFSLEIKNKLRTFLPEESSVENPIDLLGDAMEDRYEKALAVLETEKIGSVICVLTPQDQTPIIKIAEKIIDFKNKTGKAVVAVFIGADKTGKAVKKLFQKNIPNFSFPDQAVQALDAYYKWKNNSAKDKTFQNEKSSEEILEKAKNIINEAKNQGKKALFYPEAKKIMELYGIEAAEFQSINDESDESNVVKFPVALKVDSDQVLHKTDKKALILNIQDEKELRRAVQDLRINFPKENIIAQPMEKVQMELILGLKRDEIFGPVVVAGLGGIYAEVFKIAEFLIPPMSTEEIKKCLLKSKISFLFRETRGQKPFNLEELAEITHNLMLIAHDLKSILELDINPLLIYNDNRTAKAVDIKIII